MLPPWPAVPPAHGGVRLRAFTEADVHLAVELGADPYVPLIGTLPPHPTDDEAREWVARQLERHPDGIGFSFAVADAASGVAVGMIGLWLRDLAAGRASAGYAVSPAHRRRGVASDALTALTAFAWTIPELHRIELYVEPWNTGSARAARACGYQLEGKLASHQEIGGRRRDMLLFASVRSAGGDRVGQGAQPVD